MPDQSTVRRISLKPSEAEAIPDPGLTGLGPVPARPAAETVAAAVADLRAHAHEAGKLEQPVGVLRAMIRAAVGAGVVRDVATAEADDAYRRGDRERLNGAADQGRLPLALPTLRADEIEARAVSWWWEFLIPDGYCTLLVGAPKCGKSAIVADLMSCASRGERPSLAGPGRVPAGEPVGCFWAAMEDGIEDTVPARLAAAGADLRWVHMLDTRGDDGRPRFTFDEAGAAALDATLDGLEPSPRLVVVDTILGSLPPSKRNGEGGVNLNGAGDVSALLQPFMTLARRRRIALVVVHHDNKGSASASLVDKVLGSRAFTALARSVLIVGVDPSREERALMALGNLARERCLEFTLEPVMVNGVETIRVDWRGPSSRTGQAWFDTRREAATATATERASQATAVEAAADLVETARQAIRSGKVPAAWLDGDRVALPALARAVGESGQALGRALDRCGIPSTSRLHTFPTGRVRWRSRRAILGE